MCVSFTRIQIVQRYLWRTQSPCQKVLLSITSYRSGSKTFTIIYNVVVLKLVVSGPICVLNDRQTENVRLKLNSRQSSSTHPVVCSTAVVHGARTIEHLSAHIQNLQELACLTNPLLSIPNKNEGRISTPSFKRMLYPKRCRRLAFHLCSLLF